MIHYSDYSVFSEDTQTIVNTVNCVGVMGAGLALEFKLRYPEMYRDYVDRCRRKEIKIGRPCLYRNHINPWILNFPTKYHWRYTSKMEWIEEGLEYFVSNYSGAGIKSIAFPQLGCRNGRLNWTDVKEVMEGYLSQVETPVYICLDKLDKPDSIESKMVENLNKVTLPCLTKDIKMKKQTAEILLNTLPVRRFREILKIKGLGKTSYEKIFHFFYTIRSQLLLQTETICDEGGQLYLPLD